MYGTTDVKTFNLPAKQNKRICRQTERRQLTRFPVYELIPAALSDSRSKLDSVKVELDTHDGVEKSLGRLKNNLKERRRNKL